jgi:hypothetical protein
MLHRAAPAFMILTILSACAPLESGVQTPMRVYATSAASPWLESVYKCAPAGVAIELTGPDEADVVLRLTEPQPLSGAAFQVGVDELLVVTHPQAAVGRLSPEQVEALFAGQFTNWSEVGGADQPVQVWVYAPSADVQAFFDRVALHGRPISSMARLAVSAQDMSDSVGSTPGSVGLLPRRWKTGNTREASVVASVPVLVVTPQSPQGPLAGLISCMQAPP